MTAPSHAQRPSRSTRRWLGATAFVLAAMGAASGCARNKTIPGTPLPDEPRNRDLVRTVESYRERLLTKNIEGLLALASPHYFEDSGTPRADDDYGYDGLRDVLTKRLQRVKSMRYEIEYRRIHVQDSGRRAEVEVFLDGSFELAADSGDRYRRVNDYARFVLEQVAAPDAPDGAKWLFVSGM